MKYVPFFLKKVALVALFLAAGLMVRAQKQRLQFFHLTEKDGIESSFNPTIIEDKKQGFLWVGTVSGLYRYDGETVNKVYPLPGKSVKSQNHYFIFQPLLSDSRGNLWFYDNELSIKRLSVATSQVKKIPLQVAGQQDSTVKFYPVFYSGDIFEDRKGRIWANSSSHGLLCWDEKTDCFHPAPILRKLPQQGNKSKIYEDDEGWLWFSNDGRPVRYHPETGETWFAGHNPKRWPVFHCFASVFFVDSRQKMWIGEMTNAYRYDLKTQQIDTLPEVVQACNFVEDRQGRVWFGRYYRNFLSCYDPRTDRFETYRPDNINPSGMWVSDWIHTLHLDKNGLLWVLSNTAINAFRPDRPPPFTLFQHNPADGKHTLRGAEISDIFHASDGNYYLSYWTPNGGMAVLDSNLSIRETWGFYQAPFDRICDTACWNTVEDLRGRLFFAQQHGFISIFDPKTRRSKILKTDSFKNKAAQMGIRSRDGDLWWGLWRNAGLARFDHKSQRFINYPLSRGHGMVYSIVEVDSNTFWLGTEAGICKFDRKTGRDTRWILPIENPVDTQIQQHSIVGGMVKFNDSMLVGNYRNGLFRFNFRRETFHFVRAEGRGALPNGYSHLLLDGAGGVLFAYIGGFGRYWPATNRAALYALGAVVGEPFNGQIFPNSLHKGRFLLGALTKFVAVDLDALPEEKPPAVPRITLFSVANDTLRPLGRPVEASLALNFDENYFRFQFSNMQPFDFPVLYSFRLKGLRDVWSEPSRLPFANFTSVPPGAYVFEVRAHTSNGLISETARLALRIHPPFWATWWFRLLGLTAMGGLFYAIFRYREMQRLRQEQLRLRIARDLHDEVGSTLSSISILSASAMRGVEKDLDNARFGNIGEKARAALDSISDIVWSVNPQNDSMEKVLARMSAYASEMLENVETELRFEVGEGVEALSLPMEKRKDFYLIFKEAIHNCAKYARAKQVEVAIKKEDNTLILTIKDDGVGFGTQNAESEMQNMGSQSSIPIPRDETQNSKLSLGGNGLRNMRSRAAAMGAELQIESVVGTGTIILIKIPMRP